MGISSTIPNRYLKGIYRVHKFSRERCWNQIERDNQFYAMEIEICGAKASAPRNMVLLVGVATDRR